MAKKKIAFMEGISLEDHSQDTIKEVDLSKVVDNAVYKAATSKLKSPEITGVFHNHTLVVVAKIGDKQSMTLGLFSPALVKLIEEAM